MRIKVECYAGYKADERPLRFTPQAPGAHTFEVKEVLDQWYDPQFQCFKVRADDGTVHPAPQRPGRRVDPRLLSQSLSFRPRPYTVDHHFAGEVVLLVVY